jgi:hypothetical protein
MNENKFSSNTSASNQDLLRDNSANIPKSINKRQLSLNEPTTTSPITRSKLPVFKRDVVEKSPLDDSKIKPNRTVTTPVKPKPTPSKFQQFKQEFKQKPQTNFDDIAIPTSLSNNPKAFQTLLKQARVSGSLNLSNFHLTQIPDKALRINIDKFEDENNEDDETGFKWWQQIDLQKIFLASNKLKDIPKDIQYLDTLVSLDVCFW